MCGFHSVKSLDVVINWLSHDTNVISKMCKNVISLSCRKIYFDDSRADITDKRRTAPNKVRFAS